MAEQPDRTTPLGPSPTADPSGSPPPAFAHLGWRPSWRERFEGSLATTSPGRLAAAAVGALVVVVIVVVVVLRGPAPPPPELALPFAGAAGDAAPSTTASTTAPEALDVVAHAAGAVARPGVYRLAVGSRVADLLDAAGGPTPEADLDRLNLAALLVDGQQVFVPLPDEAVPPVGPPTAGAGAPALPGATAGPVDLNTATLDELDELPGVGPATAQAIVDERERRGGFTAVDELLDVRGIGDAKLAALRDLVRV